MFLTLILLISCLFAVGQDVPAGGIIEGCSDVSQHTSTINMISKLVNKGTNDQFYKRVGKVDCIRTQVVAGMLYYVEADLVKTTCRRDNDSVNELELTEARCPQKEGTETEHCNLEFWEQPWIQNMDEAYQLTKKECGPSTANRDNPNPPNNSGDAIIRANDDGTNFNTNSNNVEKLINNFVQCTKIGPENTVINFLCEQEYGCCENDCCPKELNWSKDVTAAAEQSAILLRQRMNSYSVKRIALLVSAKRQVIAGLKWTFVYYFGNTKCNQNQVDMRKPIAAAKCPFDKSSTIEKCTVELIDQPWMDPPYSLTDNHSCRPARWGPSVMLSFGEGGMGLMEYN